MDARRLGLAVLATAAVAVWFVMAPEPPDTAGGQINLSARNYANLVTQALDDFDANEARADSAPQQQVVAGWVARDLLSIIALAQADMIESLGGLAEQNETVASAVAVRDDRVPALLVIAVLAVCWIGMTTPQRAEIGAQTDIEGRHQAGLAENGE